MLPSFGGGGLGGLSVEPLVTEPPPTAAPAQPEQQIRLTNDVQKIFASHTQPWTGPIRGFAVTLGFGILTSVFTAFTVTRLFVALWVERARPKELPI